LSNCYMVQKIVDLGLTSFNGVIFRLHTYIPTYMYIYTYFYLPRYICTYR
jgi:hypothetical protein